MSTPVQQTHSVLCLASRLIYKAVNSRHIREPYSASAGILIFFFTFHFSTNPGGPHTRPHCMRSTSCLCSWGRCTCTGECIGYAYCCMRWRSLVHACCTSGIGKHNTHSHIHTLTQKNPTGCLSLRPSLASCRPSWSPSCPTSWPLPPSWPCLA